MKKAQAIKEYFQQADKIAPDSGKKVEMAELKEMIKDKAGYDELAQLAAEALGVELD